MAKRMAQIIPNAARKQPPRTGKGVMRDVQLIRAQAKKALRLKGITKPTTQQLRAEIARLRK